MDLLQQILQSKGQLMTGEQMTAHVLVLLVADIVAVAMILVANEQEEHMTDMRNWANAEVHIAAAAAAVVAEPNNQKSVAGAVVAHAVVDGIEAELAADAAVELSGGEIGAVVAVAAAAVEDEIGAASDVVAVADESVACVAALADDTVVVIVVEMVPVVMAAGAGTDGASPD